MIRSFLKFQFMVLETLVSSFVGSPNDPGLSSGGGISVGTLANRPGSSSASAYFATDTGQLFLPNGVGGWSEISYISTNLSVSTSQWLGLGAGQGNGCQFGASGTPRVARAGGPIGLGSANTGGVRVEDTPSATATAGGGAALPATVAGFFIFQDNAGTTRKVPFFAN